MKALATWRATSPATEAYVTSRRERKKVEMLFAHLKRILRLDRLRLRGPNGARDEFHLAATAQNLRKLAKLIPMPTNTGVRKPVPRTPRDHRSSAGFVADFFNNIGATLPFRTTLDRKLSCISALPRRHPVNSR